jgi:hypothetical protein
MKGSRFWLIGILFVLIFVNMVSALDARMGDVANSSDNYLFRGGGIVHPYPVNVSDDVIAFIYSGDYGWGYIDTYNVSSNGTIVGEIDSKNVIMSEIFDPKMEYVNDSMYSLVYSNALNNGEIATVSIFSNGTIGNVISTLEFDAGYLTELEILVRDDFMVISSKRPSAGSIYTVNYSSVSGEIYGLIEEFDLGLGMSTEYPEIIFYSGDIYVEVFEGADSDGYILTINITEDGDIHGIVDSWEFDSVNGEAPEILKVGDEMFSVLFENVSGGNLITVNISNNGSIQKNIIDQLFIDKFAFGSFLNVQGNLYSSVYRGFGWDGWVSTFNIYPNGTIGDSINYEYEFDTHRADYPYIIKNTLGNFSVVWGGFGIGAIATFNFGDLGEINEKDKINFSSFMANHIKFVHVDENIYFASYEGFDGFTYVSSFNLSSEGYYGVLDNVTLGTHANSDNTDIVNLSDSIFAVAYDGINNGYIQTLNISFNGTISFIDNLEFSTNYSENIEIIRLKNNNSVYAIVCEGENSEGRLDTVRILANGTVESVIDSYVFANSSIGGINPEIIWIKNNSYLIVSSESSSGDGWVYSVEILSNGTISALKYELEYAGTGDGENPSVMEFFDGLFLIAVKDSDNDGFLYSMNFFDNGTITVNTTYEFDNLDGRYPYLFRVGDKYGIVYSGINSLKFYTFYVNESTGGFVDIDSFEDTSISADAFYLVTNYIGNDNYAIMWSDKNGNGFLSMFEISQGDSFVGCFREFVSDYSFDSSSYTAFLNKRLNFSSADNLYFRGSLNVEKMGVSNLSEVYMRLTFNGNVLFDQKISTVDELGDVSSASLPIVNATGNVGINDLLIEVKETGLGGVNISNFLLHILNDKSSYNYSIDSEVGNFSFNYSSENFVNVYNFSRDKVLNATTLMDVSHRFSSNESSLAECYLNDFSTGFISPSYSRFLSSASDYGSSGIIFWDSIAKGDNDFRYYCRGSGSSEVVNDVTFLSMDMKDSWGNHIGSFFDSNLSTNYSVDLNLSSGTHKIASVENYEIKAGTMIEMASRVIIKSNSGDQTVYTYMVCDNGTVYQSNNMYRYFSSSQDVGTLIQYGDCFLSVGDIVDISLFLVVPSGESVTLKDESLVGMEMILQDVSTSNSAPSVVVIDPLENDTVSGVVDINWTVDDIHGDEYLTNVTVFNGVVVREIALNLFGNTSSIIWNTSEVPNGDWNITVKSCENETSDLLCGNDTVKVVVSNVGLDYAPLVSLLSPSDDYINDTRYYVDLNFSFTVSDDYNLQNCSLWHNATGVWHLNQTKNINGVLNGTEFYVNNLSNVSFVWNVECFDNASKSSFASNNYTVILNFTTVCGDSFCHPGENCSSCESDCGVCEDVNIWGSTGVYYQDELNETNYTEEGVEGVLNFSDVVVYLGDYDLRVSSELVVTILYTGVMNGSFVNLTFWVYDLSEVLFYEKNYEVFVEGNVSVNYYFEDLDLPVGEYSLVSRFFYENGSVEFSKNFVVFSDKDWFLNWYWWVVFVVVIWIIFFVVRKINLKRTIKRYFRKIKVK